MPAAKKNDISIGGVPIKLIPYFDTTNPLYVLTPRQAENVLEAFPESVIWWIVPGQPPRRLKKEELTNV